MALVGLVGWRGMVGSVLMDRMQAEERLKSAQSGARSVREPDRGRPVDLDDR